MSLRAYQQVARRAESPRDAEYRLFADVTRALMELKSKPREDIAGWMDALHWNRRLWSALADDCSQDGNSLLSSVAGAIWLMDPEHANQRIQVLKRFVFTEI